MLKNASIAVGVRDARPGTLTSLQDEDEEWDAALMDVAPDVEYTEAEEEEETTVFLVDSKVQSGEVQELTGDQIPREAAPDRNLPPGTLTQLGKTSRVPRQLRSVRRAADALVDAPSCQLCLLKGKCKCTFDCAFRGGLW